MTTILTARERAALVSAFQAICRTAGVTALKARLIRYTMNAVWAVEDQNLVVRMARGQRELSAAAQLVRTATLLSSVGAPVVPLAGLEQPVTFGSWSATFWILLPQDLFDTRNPTALAAPLDALHALTISSSDLPPWDVLEQAEWKLRAAGGNGNRHRAWFDRWASEGVGVTFDEVLQQLATRVRDARSALEHAIWELPTGVIHGDAHTGNLLRAPDGRLVWCDLDSVAFGPREWDLVPAAFGPARFGRDRRQYLEFVRIYGYDVTEAPHWSLLRDIRDLQSVTSVLPGISGRPALASEVARRVRGVLTGEPMIWSRYT